MTCKGFGHEHQSVSTNLVSNTQLTVVNALRHTKHGNNSLNVLF